MIFVTLGTHPQPMDRVVLKLDTMAASGAIGEEIIIQSAAYGVLPKHAVALGIEPYDRVRALMDEARVILTHGGPGSIMMALAAQRRPGVIPRDPRCGEHVDDHQQRFVRWLASRRPISPVWDLDELDGLLDPARGAVPLELDTDFGPSEAAIARVRSIIVRG